MLYSDSRVLGLFQRPSTQKLTLANIVMITLIYHVWIKLTTCPCPSIAHLETPAAVHSPLFSSPNPCQLEPTRYIIRDRNVNPPNYSININLASSSLNTTCLPLLFFPESSSVILFPHRRLCCAWNKTTEEHGVLPKMVYWLMLGRCSLRRAHVRI